MQQIRDWVYAQPYRPDCNFVFNTNRQHWFYMLTTDSGWPITNRLRVSLNSSDPQIWSPPTAFPAANVPKLYICAACSMTTPADRNTGQLFWETNGAGGFSGARSHLFSVLNDGQYHIYELNLAASNTYSGLITRLRFDPAFAGDAGDYADIAWISSSPFANNDAVKPTLNITPTNNATIVISFPTKSGETAGYVGKNLLYDLEDLTDLSTANWQGVAGFTNVLGDNTTKTFTTAPAAARGFFRVKVRLE